MVRLEGYHGTNAEVVEDILEHGVLQSEGDEHWLGDGAYFFVEGSAGVDPQGAAVKWAIASAYNNELKRNTYHRYSIIRAEINLDETTFLDLTTTEGMRVFNKIRNRFMQKIRDSDYEPRRNRGFKDGHIINLARNKGGLPIMAVKGNFYIKFRFERRMQLNFRLPNCTVLAVVNPRHSVDQNTMTCVVTKAITP